MKVGDFHELVRGLARAMAGDSAKAAGELERLAAGLEPFQDWTIADLADFLQRAEEYSRTGVVPATKRKPSSLSLDSEAIAQSRTQLDQLFERAIEPQTTYSQIQQQVRDICKGLGKEEIIAVAKQFGVSESLKSRKDALDKIEIRIARRKEGHDHLSSVRDG
jgi:hypothetical protein